MAVVNGKSDLIHDPLDSTSVPPDAKRQAGRLITQRGSVANLATDNNLSKYKLAEVPARAIPTANCFFDVASWGFAQVVIGTETDTDALVDQTKVTENIVRPIADGDANHDKEWWEILGLSAVPESGVIELWAHAEADAAGAGSMVFQLQHLVD